MDRLKDLNKRIQAKLDELDDDRAERKRARAIVHRKETRIDEIRDELQRVRNRIQRRRAVVDSIREDLQQLGAEANGNPGGDGEETLLHARLDRLSGEIEEAVAIRGHLLERLDRLSEKRDDARRALKQALDESAEDREALERMRARRKRIRERRDRPSPNFTYAEFDCNDGTPLPKQSEAAVEDWCKRIGEPARARFGSVHVNSGFRHAAYNARIGGEPASVHIYDYPGRVFRAVAGDFTCERGSPTEWYAFTAGLADGRGRYATFHHADTRGRIGWPAAVWAG